MARVPLSGCPVAVTGRTPVAVGAGLPRGGSAARCRDPQHAQRQNAKQLFQYCHFIFSPAFTKLLPGECVHTINSQPPRANNCIFTAFPHV